MNSLQTRVAAAFFITTVVTVLGLLMVVSHQVTQNFTAYLHMSGMHGMMNRGDMAMMMGLPEAQFLKSLRHSLWLAAAAMLLIGAVVSYYLARSIVRPILDLNRAVRAVTEGNLDTVVGVSRRDEVGQLSLAFNAMTSRLKTNTILRQRFLAGVAHELRTPLTILKANLEGIADGVITPDAAQMNSLSEEVDRLTKMVSELRDLSLLEAGQMKPEIAPLDLGQLLDQVVAKIQPLARGKNIHLCLEPAGLPAGIRADEGMVRQMVTNLIINAIKYTPAGGHVVVAADVKDGSGLLTIRDDGIGIGAGDIEHVFDYFYRVDPARTKASGGTGLGLALVKQMALAHGGNVQVQSEPGKGCVFTVILPQKPHKKTTVSP